MTFITIEAIEQKQTELGALIQKFKQQSQVTIVKIEARTIELQAGERYAGVKLHEDGSFSHDVIVLAARADDKNWQGAQDWARDNDGDVPSPEECALIKANCPDVFTSWIWTNKTHPDDASYARLFGPYGYSIIHHKSTADGALAVRRVPYD